MTGGGVRYSFEALGTKITAEQAFGMLRPGGTATTNGMVPLGVRSNCTASTSCATANSGHLDRHAAPFVIMAPRPAQARPPDLRSDLARANQ
jgi:threonine dehydrogenase-like Zn-dependent dehydrogenase